MYLLEIISLRGLAKLTQKLAHIVAREHGAGGSALAENALEQAVERGEMLEHALR